MKKLLELLENRKNQIFISLFIGLCFTWTGSGYLSWLYHMMDKAPNLNADLLSEVIGYIFQAFGLAIFAIFVKIKKEKAYSVKTFILISFLDMLFIAFSVLASSQAMILSMGYMMNVFHGIVAGFYLTYMVMCLPTMHQGLAFGLGYSIGSLGTFLISKFGSQNFLTSPYVLIIYAILVAITMYGIFVFEQKQLSMANSSHSSESDVIKTNGIPHDKNDNLLFANEKINRHKHTVIVMACCAVLLLSFVKGIGFYFPMADISSGSISLELTRVFYAVGLITAGMINDVNRKYGYFTCLSALVFPFVLLFMTSNQTSSLYIWIIGYIFTGFYSVYRILLVTDLINNNKTLLYMAGFGLLFGRIGDALSAYFGMTFSYNQQTLIWIGAILFMLTIILFSILAEKIYYPTLITQAVSTNYLPETEVKDSLPDGVAASTNETTRPNDSIQPNDSVDASESTSADILFFAQKYGLSSRETDILALALTDMTNVNIASQLYISENTIKFHIRNILKKTGCANRNELKDLFAHMMLSH